MHQGLKSFIEMITTKF